MHLKGRHVHVSDLLWTGRSTTSHVLSVSASGDVGLEGLRFVQNRVASEAGPGSRPRRGFVWIDGSARDGVGPDISVKDVWYIGNVLDANTPLLDILRPSPVDVAAVQASGLLVAGNTPTSMIRSNASVEHRLIGPRIDLGGAAVLERVAHAGRLAPKLWVRGAQRVDTGAWGAPTLPSLEDIQDGVSASSVPSEAVDALVEDLLSGGRPSSNEAARRLGFQ